MSIKLTVNTGILMIEKITQLFIGLFVSGIIARFLSVEEFCYWQFAVQMLAYAGVIGLICGAEIILPRLVGDETNKVLTNALVLRIVFGIITFICAFIAIYYLNVDHVAQVFSGLLFIILLFSEPFAIFACYLQSEVRNIPLAIVRLLSLLTRTILVLCVVFYDLKIYWLAFAWITEAVLTSLGYLLCFKIYRAQSIKINFNLLNISYMRNLLSYGLMFMVGQLFLMSSMRLDRMLVAKLPDTVFLGNYFVVTQLLDSLYQLIVVINLVFVTSFLYNGIVDIKRDLNITVRLLCVYLAVSLVGSLLLYWLSSYLILFIYGHKYVIAIGLLEKISFIIPFLTCTVLLHALFFKNSKYLYYLVINIASFICVSLYVYYVVWSQEFHNFIFTPYVYASCSILLSGLFIIRMWHEA